MIDFGTVVVIAFCLEVLTLFGRFFLKFSSKVFYIKLVKKLGFRYFIHFHHMFFGMLISSASFFFELHFFFNFGLGMILSDMIHHFIVLWLIVGDPEFHIIYRNAKYFENEGKREDRRFKKFVCRLVHVFD